MDMPHLPFFQFYTADWIQDTQVLNHTAKGCWIDILCQLWISPTPGEQTWNRREFITLVRLDNHQTTTALLIKDLSTVAEIYLKDEAGNVSDVHEDWAFIKIISRRMVRDWHKLNARKDKYKKYNRKRTTKERPKNHQVTTSFTTSQPPPNHQETTDRIQNSYIRSQNSDTYVSSKSDIKYLKDPAANAAAYADPSGSGSFKNKSSDSDAASPDRSAPSADSDSSNGNHGEPWRPAFLRIFSFDPHRFNRLIVWVQAQKKLNYPEIVIKQALERFEEFDRGNKIEDWWPYLQKILKKEFARHQDSEHETRKSETRKSEERKSALRALARGDSSPVKNALDMSDKERAATLSRLRALREGIGRRVN